MARPGSGGGSKDDDGSVPAFQEDSISASLEKQKFRLLQQIARDKKTKAELEARIGEAEAKILEAKQRLGEYNALFMALEDAPSKAPKQRLGAAAAVMGTKRIIEKQLTQLSKDAAVTEMKLNKQKDKNLHLKAQVDQLRKEHVTFKKLFVSMTEELAAVKARVAGTRKAVNDTYAQRDRAQEDMRELARQFELDKLERQQEWALFTEAIDKANKEGLPETMEAGTGQLTQEQEEMLRETIRKGTKKMAKDRAALALAQTKLTAYMEALTAVKAATGYDNLEDIVSLFVKYEDEKFQKVQAANRMVDEIEALEKDVAAAREEVQRRDSDSAALKAARQAEREALEKEAADLEAALAESQVGFKRIVEEVQALFPVVEFAFHGTGCDFAFDASGLQEAMEATRGPSPSAGAPSSPIRSKTASLKMYTGSQATRMEVRGGPTAGSLAAFMGILESHAADLIQQYAAMVTTGSLGHTAMVGEEVAAPAELTRRFLSPAALGPSKPHGRLKESVTTAAMVAAFAVDAAKMELAGGPAGGAGGAAGEDGSGGVEEADVRPMSLEELKKQAAAQISGDKNFKLMRSAATTAANVLTRVGVLTSV